MQVLRAQNQDKKEHEEKTRAGLVAGAASGSKEPRQDTTTRVCLPLPVGSRHLEIVFVDT